MPRASDSIDAVQLVANPNESIITAPDAWSARLLSFLMLNRLIPRLN